MVIQNHSIVKKKKSQIKIKLNIAVDNVTNEVIIVIVQTGRKIAICVNCEVTFQLNVGKEMRKLFMKIFSI